MVDQIASRKKKSHPARCQGEQMEVSQWVKILVIRPRGKENTDNTTIGKERGNSYWKNVNIKGKPGNVKW